jgi:ParB family chromosome partitioning protein
MQNLKDSIQQKGVLQPITVRELSNGEYMIIAGERRYRASKSLGLKWIPAYAVKIDVDSEMMEYALIENIQRVNLNPIEEAEGYAILREKYNLSQKEIGEKVSKSRSEIANKMRLLKLPPVIKDSVRDGTISYGHARALITIGKSKEMVMIYHMSINNNLSVRETERLVQKTINAVAPKNKKKNNKFLDFTKKLEKQFKTKIKIKVNKKESGMIQINFTSLKHLEELINKLNDEK